MWENTGAGKAVGDDGVTLGSSRETRAPAAREKQWGKIGIGTKRKPDRAADSRWNQQRKSTKKTENKQLKLTQIWAQMSSTSKVHELIFPLNPKQVSYTHGGHRPPSLIFDWNLEIVNGSLLH
jgi:hypothetical protein